MQRTHAAGLLMRTARSTALALSVFLAARAPAPAATTFAVGPQYDSTHVYVAPSDVDRFVASFLATFGGSASKRTLLTVTPTPSKTLWRFITSPVGPLSVFGFTTPIPYPFGAERTGYLVTDLDAALRAARADGAEVTVTPFPDAVGRDALIRWPGGVDMQLYWHTKAPHAAPLTTVPENRVYVSADRADEFVRAFVRFAQATVTSDEPNAPGVEIGRPGKAFRRVRLTSSYGKVTVLVTDGHLSYPYGRELTGYEVRDLAATLRRAEASGARVLAGPVTSDGRTAALLLFPGGYVAEVHASLR